MVACWQAVPVRADWDGGRVAAVAVGGTAGAALRWAALTSVDAGGFPWAVLLLNIAGSVLLGVLLAEEWSHPSARVMLHDAGAIGFCGGLTTFSTFSLEVVEFARDGETGTAVVYGVLSVAGAILGVVAGAMALRRVRALELPLEEQP